MQASILPGRGSLIPRWQRKPPNMKCSYWTLLLFISCAGCSLSKVSPSQLTKAETTFVNITNQLGPEGATIIDQALHPITPQSVNAEGYVPMLAWKKRADAFNPKYYAPVGEMDTFSSSYLTWVMQKSEFETKAQALRLKRLKGERLALRMEQLLGLAPAVVTDTARVFIEIWVKQQDLFRPCRDPEISDMSCNLYPIAGAFSPASPAYDTVYQYLVANNIRKDPPQGQARYWAPWTRMGYTYDWNKRSKHHQGLSEYIIRQGAIVKIQAKTSTADWVAKHTR